MPTRRQDLETRLVATDKASKIIESVADDLDKLDKRKDVEVEITAEDRATDDVKKLDARLDALSADDKKILLQAQAKDAQREIDRILRSLGRVDQMDDEEVKIRVEALGNAKAELDRIERQAEQLDREKVDVEVDVDDSGWRSKIGRIRTDLAKANTAFGKMSVLGGAALSNFAAYAPAAAATAAAAIGTAVGKAVTDFQTLALEAGKASDALGMSPEDVSRLIEVSGDIGVAWADVEKAIGRMNRTAETTPGAFDKINAAVVRSDDGALEVRDTFLNVIEALDRIPDAGARAAAGQQIFGKGWMQIAELIELGAEDIAAAMDEVAEGQVVDEREVQNARKLRESIDALVDRISNFAGIIGSELSPALAQAADAVGLLTTAFGTLFKITQGDFDIPVLDKIARYGLPIIGQFNLTADALGGLRKEWGDWRGEVHGTVGPLLRVGAALSDEELAISRAEAALARQTEITRELYSSTEEGARNLGLLADAQDEARTAAEEHIAALEEEARLADEMAGGFQSLADLQRDLAAASEEQARLAKDQTATEEQRVEAALRIAELQVAQFEALKQAAGETATATEKLDAQNEALLKQAESAKGPVRDALLDYIGTLNGIPPEKLTEIETLLDEGKFNAAERKVRRLSQNREATVIYDADTTAADDARDKLDDPIYTDMIVSPKVGEIVRRQSGGDVPSGGEIALVGESGPEIVALSGGSHVYTASETSRLLSGGSSSLGPTAAAANYYVNVVLQAAVIGAPFDVMRAVDKASRRAARLLPARP